MIRLLIVMMVMQFLSPVAWGEECPDYSLNGILGINAGYLCRIANALEMITKEKEVAVNLECEELNDNT